MSAPLDCPAAASWHTLLAGLTPTEQELYEHHLESCPICQQQLEESAPPTDEFLQLARQFGDPTQAPVDATLAAVLQRLHGAAPPADDLAELYFLRPTDRPGLLGMVGEFEVQQVIGRGGMGVVLKAFEPALHRLVALKVMAASVAGSPTARQRFKREAQAAARVVHDHIVAVHGVHDAGGLPYLVMQYVAGESLQDRLDREGPLPADEVVRIGLQTAQGLAAAHAEGLIHRDIKPANLLLEGEPGVSATGDCTSATGVPSSAPSPIRVKITDFGLARMIDDVSLTRAGVVAGTPEYMAPEQARGETVDHRADLFSLGSVLYACCTGAPPFAADNAVAVLRQVSDQPAPPIRSQNPAVPAWLESLIDRLMTKNPDQRVQTAQEVVALLEGYLAHLRQPQSVRPPELPRAPRRGPSAAGLPTRPRFLLACIVLASAAFAPLLFQAAPAEPVRQRPVVKPAIETADVWSLAVSADGKLLVGSSGLWDQPGDIGIWDLASRTPLQRFADELGIASVVFSPDSKRIALGGWSGHVRVYDWAAGRELYDLPFPGVVRLAISPDGKLLAAVTEDQTAQLYDLETGKLVADLAGDLFRFHCVTFSPDGRLLLAGGGEWEAGSTAQVTIWDLATRTQVGKLAGHHKAVLSIAYSPDGKTIATGGGDFKICLWDVETGECVRRLTGHRHFVESVTFSPDGKTLLSGSLDGTARFWELPGGEGITPQVLRRKDSNFLPPRQVRMPGRVRIVRYLPDGTILIGGGKKTLKLYDAAGKEELAVLWGGAEPMTSAMEQFPITIPGEKPQGRGWLMALGLVGVGLGFLASAVLGLVLSLRRPPPDALALSCPECERKIKVRATLVGKKVKCPRCGAAVPVPAAATRRRWARPDALAAWTTSGVLAALLVVGLWPSPHRAEPYVSKLQLLAERVRMNRAETIDGRPYPDLGDRDLTVLAGLSNLRSLNLDHSATTNEGLKEVAKAVNLTTLSLTNTQVTDSGLAELRPLTSLMDLRLDRLPITDAGLVHLTVFAGLKKLSLYKTAVTDAGMESLRQLQYLQRLSLDDTQVGDEGLRQLGTGCPRLKYLSVWKTQATPAGIQALRKARPGLQVNK